MTEILRKGGISNMKKPLVAVTLGDPAGIGPEIVVKTVADKDLFEEANCIVIGDAGIVKQAIGVTGVDLKVNCVEDPSILSILPMLISISLNTARSARCAAKLHSSTSRRA